MYDFEARLVSSFYFMDKNQKLRFLTTALPYFCNKSSSFLLKKNSFLMFRIQVHSKAKCSQQEKDRKIK